MGHVFVRLAGHGARLVPYWPYRFTGSAGSSRVQVTVFADEGERRAVVGAGAASVPGVVDVDAGPDGDWRLELGPFSLCWPAGFGVESPTDPGDGTACYLLGPDDALILPQGPVPLVRLAGSDALVAPGQRVVDRRLLDGDIDVVELAYAHEGPRGGRRTGSSRSGGRGHWSSPGRPRRWPPRWCAPPATGWLSPSPASAGIRWSDTCPRSPGRSRPPAPHTPRARWLRTLAAA